MEQDAVKFKCPVISIQYECIVPVHETESAIFD